MGDPAVERLTEFLGQQYPELEGLELHDLSEISGGWETDLYSLRVMGERNGQPAQVRLVLRLYKGANPIEKARKEFSLMTGVTRLGIATPRVDALVTDRSILGDPFIVMERIGGDTLEARIGKSDAPVWIDPMIRILARIHGLPWKELIPKPEGPLPEAGEPSAFVESFTHDMDQAIDQHGLTDFKPTMDWLRERETLGAATVPALVHNDYHPQNILLREGEMVIIDWSFAEISDYRMDLAWTVLLSGVMVGQEHRPAMLEAYERATGMRVDNFEYFEALKLTMRMLTIATWLDETVEIPVARISKQAIRGDYKVHALNPYRRLKEITGLEISTIEEL